MVNDAVREGHRGHRPVTGPSAWQAEKHGAHTDTADLPGACVRKGEASGWAALTDEERACLQGMLK